MLFIADCLRWPFWSNFISNFCTSTTTVSSSGTISWPPGVLQDPHSDFILSIFISVTTSSFILRSFVVCGICNVECLQMLQIVYIGGFLKCLLVNYKWIQYFKVMVSQFCDCMLSKLFCWIVILSLHLVCFFILHALICVLGHVIKYCSMVLLHAMNFVITVTRCLYF